jgi:acyl transferase domain-containing protein/acyl carrier protein
MIGGQPSDPLDGVAIIGMGGRFPGASDVDTFWRNLRDGVDAVRVFSDDELIAAGVPASALTDPAYVKAGPVLDDVDAFDADFFGVSAREAELTDPQQRLFLECAWEAIEHAGYDVDRLAGRVGVFAGAGLNTYLLHLVAAGDLLNSPEALQAILANATDHLATHVSYKLNLRGPSLGVQTACSTSLVAVHLAVQSLLGGESDLALAGGVSVSVPQATGYRYQEGMILAPDGRCRAFDAAAAGTVGGSGVGLVILKRAADAVADGDTIYAIIRGSAINNDGAAKVGYSAPSADGQADVIAEALALAGVEPESVAYVEAHGTGTPLGDPIEIAALGRVFGAGRGPRTCALGSVKTNVGHLDAAAGIAGLIKAALSLHHQELPPTLHFTRPNPQLQLDRTPFYVNTSLQPWPRTTEPRRAGVSSFGIGGTNAHVVLEEAPVRSQVSGVRLVLRSPEPAKDGGQEELPSILVLSARTPAALDAAGERLASYLRAYPDLDLEDAAFTLQAGRRAFPYRRAIVASDRDAAIRRLDEHGIERPARVEPPLDAPAIAFLFPGQGAQYVGMGRHLYEQLPTFRATVDACAERLCPLLGLDVRALLYPPDGPDGENDAAADRLRQTAIAQPALFSIELALARQLQAWGVTPSAVAGHSLGEYVAACLAGVFTADDALALVAERGRLMQSCAPGAMLGVSLAEGALVPYLSVSPDDGVALAAVNGPAQCVVGGPAEAIDRLQVRLTSDRVTSRRLVTSHAFHTPMMEPAVSAFAARVARTARSAPVLPWVSTVTGTWITPEQATDPAYWARQIRQPVRFGAAITTLLGDPGRTLIEVGPGRTLASLVRLQTRGRRDDGQPEVPVVGTMRHPEQPRSDVAVLLDGLGAIWTAGAAVDWTAYQAGAPRQRVPLPTYPFERRRFWIGGIPVQTPAGAQVADNDRATPGRYSRPNLGTPYRAPQGELDEVIATHWRELFGLATVGIDDDFFDLGGHSLLATQLIARLRDSFAVDVPVRAIFEAPTIAALSETIESLVIEQVEQIPDEPRTLAPTLSV